ncbi:MAG: PRD domain-containing protein [Actinomycetota bacterium]
MDPARFITHLRYFFIRMHQGGQLAGENEKLVEAIRGAYPEAFRCALRVQEVLELRLEQPITPDEVAYLTMHVARLTTAA